MRDIQIFDIEKGFEKQTHELKGASWINCLCSFDDYTFVSGADGGHLQIFDLKAMQQVFSNNGDFNTNLRAIVKNKFSSRELIIGSDAGIHVVSYSNKALKKKTQNGRFLETN